jgi:hypothetical protein
MSLVTTEGFNGDLAPGESVLFILDWRALHALKGQVSALCSERYSVSVRSGNVEILSIPGRVVGEFLEQL